MDNSRAKQRRIELYRRGLQSSHGWLMSINDDNVYIQLNLPNEKIQVHQIRTQVR